MPTTTVYVGPGDVVSGASAWWGLRAYSNATIGSNAVRLRENGGNTESDFATIAGGGLDLAAIATFKGANSLFVTKLYDQTGGGRDLTQVVAASQPPFTLAVLGSYPAIDATTGATSWVLTCATPLALVQPYSISGVLQVTNSKDMQYFFDQNNFPQVRPNFTGSGTLLLFAGSLFSVTMALNTWHAVQTVYNSASSDGNIDGTRTTGDAGANSFTGGPLAYFGDGGAGNFIGYGLEVGVWPSGFSAAQETNMNTNQHAYWGF